MTHDVATQRCPSCRRGFRVLEDEVGMHECPHCGYDGDRDACDEARAWHAVLDLEAERILLATTRGQAYAILRRTALAAVNAYREGLL